MTTDRAGAPKFAAAIVAVALLSVYIASLAPTVTYWDAGEFLSAIHSLGVPHPPGTPMFILIGNVWAKVFAPVFGYAYSVNLLSAVCTATACGIAAWLMNKWTGDSIAAVAGGITAGLMSSVWLNATETEVYSPALLVSLILLLVADRARETRDHRWLVLLAYMMGFGWSLQLSALVAAPAAVFLALWMPNRNPPVSGRTPIAERRSFLFTIASMAVVAALGASAVLFMLLRARHDPAINQGNPATWQMFSDVISRRQYMPVGMLPRQAPLYLQIGNMFEYADWQVALGLAPDPPPTIARTTMTLIFAALGVVGFIWHRRKHVASWEAMTLLLISATIGIVVYLNMKASPSYGEGFLAATAKHEARERDYFFALGFICWGLWAGAGSVALLRRLNPRAALVGVAFASLPVILNWSAVDRRQSPKAFAARDSAQRIFSRAPMNAVVFALGDNDTYPVWYMQEVEGRRRDVTSITLPLLGAKWYRQELARRHQLLDSGYVDDWKGIGKTYANICTRARELGRPVRAPSITGAPPVPEPCK
ncbi:MAG TPA: DUF2723 domain-containing protein [Gemmatimonadaceae bacterium]|nr:DUF2723 domain-containing protein [Gemmatimonadaceae bacterium]